MHPSKFAAMLWPYSAVAAFLEIFIVVSVGSYFGRWGLFVLFILRLIQIRSKGLQILNK